MIDEYAFENIDTSDDLITLFSELYGSLTTLKEHIEKDRFVDGLNTYIYVFAKYIQLAEPLNISYEEAVSYFHELSVSA
jgi:dimeric dUTPase (all-alpha-NTP-PPase superfamily)